MIPGAKLFKNLHFYWQVTHDTSLLSVCFQMEVKTLSEEWSHKSVLICLFVNDKFYDKTPCGFFYFQCHFNTCVLRNL